MKNKSKPKRKFINEGILGFDWLLQYGGTEDSAYEWYAKKYKLKTSWPKGRSANWGSFTYHEDELYVGLIWIEKGRGSNTISHEVSHAVLHMFHVLKVVPKEAEEIFARYTGWLNKELADLYYRK